MTHIDDAGFERARAKVLRAIDVGYVTLAGTKAGRLDPVSRHAFEWWKGVCLRQWILHVAVVELTDVCGDVAVGRVVVGHDSRRPNLEYRVMSFRLALRRSAELKSAGPNTWASSTKLLWRAEKLAERILAIEAELREKEMIPVVDGLPVYDDG